MTKRSWIVLLVGLNLLLLLVLLGTAFPSNTVFAQAGASRGGAFLSVVAKPAGQSYDVLYLVDVPNRKLHAVYPPNQANRQLSTAPPRDLAVDFGNKP